MSTSSVLVNFNGLPTNFDSLVPDNGLANLAGALTSRGHETRILDFSTTDIFERIVPQKLRDALAGVYGEMAESLRSGKGMGETVLQRLVEIDGEIENHKRKAGPAIAEEVVSCAEERAADFIGFKLWTGEGFEFSAQIARRIKRMRPNLRLFGGGPHVDWFMERVFDYTDVFDALAYGEGEETITLLADSYEGKIAYREIPNLILKINGRITITERRHVEDLNGLPDPVYSEDIYPALKGDRKIKMIMIDESRGCPNRCNFCIHPKKSGNRWRTRHVSSVVDLIEALSKQLGVRTFRLAGSNTPPLFKKKFAEEILHRRFPIAYAAFSQIRSQELEVFDLLKKSGCLSLFYGVESGNQKILTESFNKGITASQIKTALKRSREAGILTVASIIFPAPHENESSIQDTLEVLTEAHPDSVTIQLPGVIPGTEWFTHRKTYGIELDDDYFARSQTYRIKLQLPPLLWSPLPYRINGRTSSEMALMASRMESELGKNGIMVGVNDFGLLIAKYLQMDPRTFRDKNRWCFFTADVGEVGRMIKAFNRRASTAPRIT